MTHGDTSLSPQEQLLLHQLLQKRFWAEDSSTEPPVPREQSPRSSPRVASPPRWELTKELTLHDWQQRCIEAWFANGKRGVIKVVTGAGKTILALAIAERLQHTDTPDLRVAIVVPTIVLMDQWHEELLRRSNLPLESIGLSGGGFQHRFSDGYRILICVLNSAAKKLPLDVQRAGDVEPPRQPVVTGDARLPRPGRVEREIELVRVRLNRRGGVVAIVAVDVRMILRGISDGTCSQVF